MKKLMLLFFIYLLVEGNNVVGDLLYVYTRGNHAINQLAEQVDKYGPVIQNVDTTMTNAIEREMAKLDQLQTQQPEVAQGESSYDESDQAKAYGYYSRPVIYRNRPVSSSSASVSSEDPAEIDNEWEEHTSPLLSTPR